MNSKQSLQFIEANIDVEKLINEVQERPALWDMSQKVYNDRIKRKQCWKEITELFSFESDLSLEDKTKLGDILQKKWKNIRDRYTRDIQERKAKSEDGARKKLPYMYSHHLEFLRDTVILKRTVSLSERTSAESTSIQEEREEEEHEDDEEEDQEGDQVQEAISASSTHSPTPNVLCTEVTQADKKRPYPVEKKISRSLDMYKKRAKMDRGKKMVEDNSSRHFLLSLVQSLASLPRHINTSCKIEILQCINKYEIMSEKYQQPNNQLQSSSSHTLDQLQSSLSYTLDQLQPSSQQYLSKTFVTPRQTPSPAESVTSYMSKFTDENDSQLSNS